MSFSSDIKKVRQKSLLSQEAFAQAVVFLLQLSIGGNQENANRLLRL